jgi:hypothetical protein
MTAPTLFTCSWHCSIKRLSDQQTRSLFATSNLRAYLFFSSAPRVAVSNTGWGNEMISTLASELRSNVLFLTQTQKRLLTYPTNYTTHTHITCGVKIIIIKNLFILV